MALIAIASDKGAPGVTTAALALAAVWPRPVLLAECDPAGGDLVYRFPAVGGGHLDPRRGVLSLAVVARRGMQPQQVWEHVQKLHGGLDVLAGVTNAEQGAGLSLLWGPIGKALASMPQADVIADCGRLGADGPLYDLLAEATTVVLVTKVHVADVIRLRDRATAFAAAAQSRGRRNFGVGVVVVADHKKFRASLGEVQHVLGQANAPATVLGGIAHDPKGADLLSGEWGGNLDRTMLIKTAREVARQLVQGLPPIGNPAESGPATMPAQAQPQPAHPQRAHAQPQPGYAQPEPRGARRATGPQPAGPQPAGPHPGWSSGAGPQPVAARYSGPQPAYPASGPDAPASAQSGTAPAGPQHAPAPAATVHGPADLAAVTLAAPPVSDDAPRTTFSRVRGRPGRHQADPGQAPNGQLPNGQASSGPAPGGQAINGEAQPAPPAGGHALTQTGGHTATQAAGYAATQPVGYAATQASAQPQPRVARHAHGGNRQETGSPQETSDRQETGSRPEVGHRHASFFSRPPMTPLTTPGAQAPVGPSEARPSEARLSEGAGPPEAAPPGQEDAEDTGWGATSWDRQGPAGSMGSRRSGGG
jgi:MinD-like ATPase involved in chromosome partitioning or flagellar assembly